MCVTMGAILMIILGLTFGWPVWAQSPGPAGLPVAIVEDVVGEVKGVAFMDYLEEGRRIALGPGQSLTLGYLRSCVREVIHDGEIVIGHERSQAIGARVASGKTKCAGAKLQLTAAQAGKSGVIVFRRPPVPDLVLYATAPFVSMSTPGRVTFERLDRAAPPIAVDLTERHTDLERRELRLEPGGLYRVSAAGESVVVQVAPTASAGGGPLLSRLIRF